jgi:imidazolonepropionase-like amidohydrolase
MKVLTRLLALGLFALTGQVSAQQPTLALVGGRIIDGYGGPLIENGVILIVDDRIVAVGPRSDVDVPGGTSVVSTEGMTMMPGLFDMHVHLMILGHGDYARWDELFGDKLADEVMPIAARQLLEAGVTSARDLGAPLDDILTVKRRIAAGEIPGPRLFVSGPFIQRAPYEPWEAEYRWGVNGPDDARQKVQQIIDAGVDFIKLIDQDQLTAAEVAAVVETAHANGKPVVAHAHRPDEIRIGLDAGVDNFEHTGLATAPGYPDDVLQRLRERNAALFWTPTISPLYVMQYSGEIFPERLDDPGWKVGMTPAMANEIRASLQDIPQLPYYALFPSRIPRLPEKFRQLRETGVQLLIGTDAGIPSMFHNDATWREMVKWVELGIPPMQVIQAATLWPARFLQVQDDLGTLSPGRLADVIAVRGDPLTSMDAMRNVAVVVQGGKQIR